MFGLLNLNLQVSRNLTRNPIYKKRCVLNPLWPKVLILTDCNPIQRAIRTTL